MWQCWQHVARHTGCAKPPAHLPASSTHHRPTIPWSKAPGKWTLSRSALLQQPEYVVSGCQGTFSNSWNVSPHQAILREAMYKHMLSGCLRCSFADCLLWHLSWALQTDCSTKGCIQSASSVKMSENTTHSA